MATTNIELTGNSWTKVEAIGTDGEFLLENLGPFHAVEVAFGGAPAAGVRGHILDVGDALIRAKVPGDVYVRSAEATLVVSA